MNTYAEKDLPDEDDAVLMKMVMQLFQHWQLSNDETFLLLGLEGMPRPLLERDTRDRIKYLLCIHKNLRTIFSYNKNLVHTWPKTPNCHFHEKTPVQVIIEEGLLGLVQINNYLVNYVEADLHEGKDIDGLFR